MFQHVMSMARHWPGISASIATPLGTGCNAIPWELGAASARTQALNWDDMEVNGRRNGDVVAI
jgi:hypothetical protein